MIGALKKKVLLKRSVEKELKRFFFLSNERENIIVNSVIEREVFCYDDFMTIKNRMTINWNVIEIESSKYSIVSNIRDKETKKEIYCIKKNSARIVKIHKYDDI